MPPAHPGRRIPDGDQDRAQTVWVHDVAAPVRDASGRVFAWQGMALDITAHRAAEDALAASEARFRTAFEKCAHRYGARRS